MKKVLILLIGIFFLLVIFTNAAQAKGLIDDTVNSSNNYSKYPVDNYGLDYFVDSKWDWLPWNWGDGIGKSVMFGIYSITNLIWLISVYLANAAGYLVGEAYSLDFISDTTESIGRNIQTLAGINQNGFMSSGFYPGLLLILILIMGIYVTYTGLIKRETTKATSALVSFITIFLLSSSFIAYSTNYISKINDFSSDISGAALNIGSKMIMPNSTIKGKSSVDAIRDSLFEIQVKQPWMILQYGDSDIEKVGKDRVKNLESTSPFANKGKDRIKIVKEEIDKKNNDNLTITKTVNRLGVAFFIFIFNILISIFVFILTGIMIFSQVLFIVFAIFLPVSFLLSMIPSFNHLMKSTIMRLFNVIMMRAGITLVLTISFSLSAMIYSLTASQPFFIVAFMQIVVFAGIYFKLNDLMGMMALNSTDSQNTGSHVWRRSKQTGTRAIRKIAIGGLALRGLGLTRNENTATKEKEKAKNSKNTDKQDNPSVKNRQRENKNILPNSEKQNTQIKSSTKKDKQTGKQYVSLQQNQDKAKQDAGRKFKQSKYKKQENKPKTSNAGNNQQPIETEESKRKNAPTRFLEKIKPTNLAKPVPKNTSDRKTKQNSIELSRDTSIKYGKKPIYRTPQRDQLIQPNQSMVKVLGDKKSVKQDVRLNKKERVAVSQISAKKKSKVINGKGAKRK